MTISVRDLYGLIIAVERLRVMLVDFFYTLGFVLSYFDRNVYVRLRDPTDKFSFICIHVDDFKAVAKDPDIWIEYISSVFLIKENGQR